MRLPRVLEAPKDRMVVVVVWATEEAVGVGCPSAEEAMLILIICHERFKKFVLKNTVGKMSAFNIIMTKQ